MASPLHASHSFALLRGALIALLVTLMGCTLRAGKQAVVPPPPSPAVAQPPAPAAPLSVPQTAVTLPGYQEVNPDAIPSTQATTTQTTEPEKTEASPAVSRPRRSTASQKPVAGEEPEAAAPPAAEPEKAPIQPILTEDEHKRIREAIDTRRKEIDERLNRAKRHVSSHDQSLKERIASFLAQCSQAEKRGDYAQADALSERALILAQELPE